WMNILVLIVCDLYFFVFVFFFFFFFFSSRRRHTRWPRDWSSDVCSSDLFRYAGKDSRADILMHTESGSGADKSRTSGLSGVVTSKSVTDLPLNGRSASDLAALEPGVATARTQSTGQAQRGFGTQMTISGGRPRQNDAQLDGI